MRTNFEVSEFNYNLRRSEKIFTRIDKCGIVSRSVVHPNWSLILMAQNDLKINRQKWFTGFQLLCFFIVQSHGSFQFCLRTHFIRKPEQNKEEIKKKTLLRAQKSQTIQFPASNIFFVLLSFATASDISSQRVNSKREKEFCFWLINFCFIYFPFQCESAARGKQKGKVKRTSFYFRWDHVYGVLTALNELKRRARWRLDKFKVF